MNWPSARSIRASPAFSTTKREPESFAAVSKSICPSASPSSKCSFAQFDSARSPHLALEPVRMLVRPHRHIVERHVRDHRQRIVQRLRRRPLLRLGRAHRFLERRHLRHQRRPRAHVLLRLGLADLLRRRVAAGLRLLQLADRGAARLVERDQPLRRRLRAAVLQRAIQRFGFSRIQRMSSMLRRPAFVSADQSAARVSKCERLAK